MHRLVKESLQGHLGASVTDWKTPVGVTGRKVLEREELEDSSILGVSKENIYPWGQQRKQELILKRGTASLPGISNLAVAHRKVTRVLKPR